MARKRRRLTASQARAFRAGLARGRLLAKAAEHRKRSRAAAKAAVTRAKRKAEPKPPAAAVQVAELLLFDATGEDSSPPAFTPLASWPTEPVECRYRLFLNSPDTPEPDEVDRVFLVEWDAESLPKSFFRDVRQAVDEWRAENPDSESPQAGIMRFALTLT